MENFKNKYCAITLSVGLIAGFLLGMEYKAYQIRSAFSDAADEISELFGGGDATEAESDNKEPEERPVKSAEVVEEERAAERLRQLVDLDVVDKGFTKADFYNGPYESSIDFGFKLTNKTDKEVKGVQGIIVFYDIFDNEIYRSGLAYDEGIPANDSYTWKAGIDYNEFMDDHQKLLSMELENLQYEWIPDTVIYSDGTKVQ